MDIETVVQQLGIEASKNHHHARSGWLQIKNCPYCHSSNFHLGVHVHRLYTNCYRCGRHNLVDVLNRLSGVESRKIAGLLKGLDVKAEKVEIVPRPSSLKLPPGIGPLQKPHNQYLATRGFNPAKLSRLWGLQGLGIEAGELAWRIFVPIEVDGRLVSWTTRSISPNSKKRYHTCPAHLSLLPRNEILYGQDFVRHCAILCEGPADVWAIGPGGVCPLGTSISAHQINMMSNYPIRVVCLDSQPEAQKVAKSIVSQLEVFDGETYNVVLDAKDPGEATRKEIKHLRRFFKL